ncbi:polysaccharide biosynthesis/export family protein [Cerasicoccus fimbriatus]|uniref:polysaccharide biosynthesis/export family protein n=1 Tax=Cerasicoccus fimbriatus TaxID=3014554 RepID=UPI0022B3DC16|nr:polysaccharide biosynthesis/export family protein [Cerasicoccus sp. TK19100]
MNRFTCLCFLAITCFFATFAQAQNTAEAKNRGLIGSNYTLQPLDIVQMTVYKEPELEQQVRVSQEGTVILPLVGEVQVGGMTITNATRLITDLYNRDYLVNPQVTLLLISYTERRAYVHGQVNRPGPVIIPPEETMTLSQVISAAGSTTRLASDTIRVTRTESNGKKTVYELEFDEILEDPDAKDIIIMDGDSIYVPERII